jgi:tetratricopeptide (TPR) repeat protein
VSSAVSDKKQLVEEIVVALTGAIGGDPRPATLVDQMSRAAQEVDERTANAFGKALLDNLCEDPGNVRLLEALMILGLAHPEVLRSRGISLRMEGRRLAVLLEQRGEGERARSLLELIQAKDPEPETATAVPGAEAAPGDSAESSGDLVESYLKKARACVKKRRIPEAISWLQEVLLVDRSRRDVARMIRDLRYRQTEGRARRKRVARTIFTVLLVGAVLAGIGWREARVRELYLALPPAPGQSDADLRARLATIEGFVATHRVWHGLLDARGEMHEIQAELEARRAEAAEAERQRQLAITRRLQLAEAARLRGLMRVERGEFEIALEDFRESLELADEDWEHRERVVADVAALEAWQRGER